jgi:hypothetical protein
VRHGLAELERLQILTVQRAPSHDSASVRRRTQVSDDHNFLRALGAHRAVVRVNGDQNTL